MAQGGDVATGVELVKRAIAAHAGWADLLGRLDPSVAPAAEVVRRALGLGPPPT